MTIAPLIPAYYGISRGILEERTSVVIDDASTHPLTAQLYAKGRNVPGRFHFESYAGAPMLGGDGAVGLIGIYSCRERRSFDQQTMHFLQIVANHFGVLIMNNQLKSTLEQRVIERTAELAAARDAATAASRAKSEFLACMSHELQTPLNSIVGFGQILTGTTLDTAQREAVDCMLQSSRHLVDIIKDILDFTHLETGRLLIQSIPFNPMERILPTFELLKPQAETKGLSYTLHADPGLPPALLGDPVRISQIVLNLLSNAIKFTERGHVRLVLRYGILPGAVRPALVISVEDSGVGVTEAVRPSLFKPFTQANQSASREFGGVGLGLSLVDRLVKAMGGTIEVASAPGRGTTVTVVLPCAEAPRVEHSPRKPPTNPAVANTRVLIVEDNETNRLVLRRMLERMGVASITAVDGGEAALQLMDTSRFDLVLMDVHMPGMDGVECTTQIRARDWWAKNVPIVAVTAGSGSDDFDRSLSAGMNAVVPKPVESARLSEVLLRYAPDQAN
jgi:signal transduction histidine kinase/ActR/RegA family two-component response regulator